MEPLIKVQDDLSFRIQRAFENFKKSPKERRNSVDYVKARLDLLEDLWTQFSQTHTLIIQDSDSTELLKSSYVENSVYEETEDLYIEYKCLMKSQLSKINPSSTAPSQNAAETGKTPDKAEEIIKLPKISIPTFSGEYSEWTSFRDLFVSLIHKNNSLDNVQKLHYLKSHLTGEAEQLLRHVPITQENYSTSWEQLEKRYNNKKFLSNCILKRLLSQRNLATESASALKDLLDTTNECLQALKNLGIDVKSWDIIVVHLLCLKLDAESRKQWELKSSEMGNELPTYEQFKSFLETRFRALEFIDPQISRPSTIAHKGFNTPISSKIHHVIAPTCVYCSEAHKISNCKQFSKIDTDARRDIVKTHKLCFNCLGSTHTVYKCRQPFRCRICKRKHHSLLHSKDNTPTSTAESRITNYSVVANVVVPATTSQSSPVDEPATTVRAHASTTCGQVLLPTALVNVTSNSGKNIRLRCLLDQGSQASLITESAVQLLGLRKQVHKGTISGLGSDKSATIASKSIVEFKIQSLLDASAEFEVNAFVLSKLTSILPERRIVVRSWSEFENLSLADPSFNQPNKIDLILGADIYGKILQDGVVKGSPGASLTAQKTALGWILSGPTEEEDHKAHTTVRINHVIVNGNDNDLLKTEQADSSSLSPRDTFNEERRCKELFAATTKRDSSDGCSINLSFRAFREEDPKYEEEKCHIGEAISCSPLKKLFEKDLPLQDKYKTAMKENEDVRDAHVKRVLEEDENKHGVTFRKAATSCLTVEKMLHVAHNHGQVDPLASDNLLKDFQVDNLLSRCETVAEGEKIYGASNGLLGKPTFELVKETDRSSRSDEQRKLINQDVNYKEEKMKLNPVRTLLGAWNRKSDRFEYPVHVPPPFKVP